MELRFWGVRGSIAVPGADTVRVGGNTSCISVLYGDYVFVFDAGTGIRQLGRYLGEKDRLRLRGSVFLTHYHWDHIQGLPFFGPAFRSENRFHIYGEKKKGAGIEEILTEQMEPPYFPIDMENLEGFVTFTETQPGIKIDVFQDVSIRTARLPHPNGAIGYRLDGLEGSLCYITDLEHPLDTIDESVVEFVQDSEVLIHDSQYTPEEKKGPKSGWGHSSWEDAALTAREARVKQLYLFHHDPDRTDKDFLPILKEAQKVFENTEIATEASFYVF